jgi:hypothetical protein
VIARRRPVEPRHIAERHQPLAVPPRHDGQALPHEGAVHAPERRHIGHRRQRHEVEHRHQVGARDALGAQAAVEVHQQQEHHGRGAEMAERPSSSCRLGFTTATQSGSVASARWWSSTMTSAPFAAAMGPWLSVPQSTQTIRSWVSASPPWPRRWGRSPRRSGRGHRASRHGPSGAASDQERRGTAAVHVVIGENGDPSRAAAGPAMRGGRVHVLQDGGVGQQVAQGRGEERLGLLRRTPRGRGRRRRRARAPRAAPALRPAAVLFGVRPHPAAAGQRACRRPGRQACGRGMCPLRSTPQYQGRRVTPRRA